MKKSDLIGGAISYIALVVIVYQCIFGWAQHTADDNSRIAQEAKDEAKTYISHYYEYERYLYETGQAFDEFPF